MSDQYTLNDLLVGINELLNVLEDPSIKDYKLMFVCDGQEYSVVGAKVIDDKICFISDTAEFVRSQIYANENGFDVEPLENSESFIVRGKYE